MLYRELHWGPQEGPQGAEFLLGAPPDPLFKPLLIGGPRDCNFSREIFEEMSEKFSGVIFGRENFFREWIFHGEIRKKVSRGLSGLSVRIMLNYKSLRVAVSICHAG